jgi:hypothetical protein
MLVWPLDARCVPFFYSSPIIENLGGTVGSKAEPAEEEIAFDYQPVPIGCRVHPVYLAELDPVPVAHQKSRGGTKAKCPLESYPSSSFVFPD